MSDVSESELNTIRLRILDLIKSFFMGEPDEKKVATWQEVIPSITGEKINPVIDAAAVKLETALSSMTLEELQQEYYELFTDPFSASIVHSTLSYYADGHDFGQSLVDLRRFLISAEITSVENLDESEDSLVFLLDILTTLIRDEEQHPDKARKNQNELLTQFLEPFSAHFSSALQQNERAKFFEACAAFLSGYVDLEKGLIV